MPIVSTASMWRPWTIGQFPKLVILLATLCSVNSGVFNSSVQLGWWWPPEPSHLEALGHKTGMRKAHWWVAGVMEWGQRGVPERGTGSLQHPQPCWWVMEAISDTEHLSTFRVSHNLRSTVGLDRIVPFRENSSAFGSFLIPPHCVSLSTPCPQQSCFSSSFVNALWKIEFLNMKDMWY